MRTPPHLPAHLVPLYFAWDQGMYKRLADGSYKAINSVNGNKLIVMHNGERINADDIAWCLHHGNWPHYPLVQIDGNPYNTAIENIYPVRTKAIRFRAVPGDDGLFQHPLSDAGFRTPAMCRENWNRHAIDHYRKDLGYVLRLESEARQLRAASAPAQELSPAATALRPAKQSRAAPPPRDEGVKPHRPPRIPGHAWHYYNKAWLSVPEAVHVSDDYRARCEAVLKGAVRFEFQPACSETWAFNAEGERVR